jgi:hypothetical protein
MTYHQLIKWREDGRGLVVARLVISDSYDGLFLDIAESTSCSCFIVDEVSKSIKDSSGGIEKRQVKFSVNETLIDQADLPVIEFVKQVEDQQTTIFLAVFIDTANIPLVDDMLFQGVINSKIEGEDLRWFGEHFDTNITPLRILKFSASPYDDAVFGKFELKDLIYGNEEKNIPGISEAWESENVKDRQGYFDFDGRRVCVDSLVNLNDLLRILADNLEAAIADNGYGNINIAFDASKITGNWHPARWNLNHGFPFDDIVSRYIQYQYHGKLSAYNCFPSEKKELWLMPDSKPESIVENEKGVPDNPETFNYYSKSPWISYRRIKPLEQEQSSDLASNIRFEKIKTFFELINRASLELGLFAKIYWDTANTLKISFRNRHEEIGALITLKSATEGSIKPMSNEIQDEKKFKGTSFYWANEGFDIYSLNNDGYASRAAIPFTLDHESTSIDDILFTLSPTLCFVGDGSDAGRNGSLQKLPHNHIFYEGLEKSTYDKGRAIGTHSGIYLCSIEDQNNPDWAASPIIYWTPAAMLTVNINGEEKQFQKMADYLNYIQSRDIDYQLYEYSLEIPWFYGARNSEDVTTWKTLDILNQIELNGVKYVIVEAKHSLSSVQVSLTLHSLDRFSFADSFEGELEPPDFIYLLEKEGLLPEFQATPIISAGTIYNFDMVSQKSDMTYERALPVDEHYERIHGIAIVNSETNEIVRIIKSGIFSGADLPDYPVNTFVWLRKNDEGINLSNQFLADKTENEDMVVRIGRYVDFKTIELDEGFNFRYIYE